MLLLPFPHGSSLKISARELLSARLLYTASSHFANIVVMSLDALFVHCCLSVRIYGAASEQYMCCASIQGDEARNSAIPIGTGILERGATM